MTMLDNVWAGVGFETGGEMLIGLSQQAGTMLCVGDLIRTPNAVRWMTFQQEAVTAGLGLGGAGGFNFVIGVNATAPQDFDGAPPGSFDFSLDMAMGGLGKYLRSAPEMIELAAIANKFDGKLMSLSKALTSYEKNAYFVKDAAEGLLKNGKNLFDASQREPTMLSLPLPGSLGLRASIKMKFETTDVTSWGSTSFVFV